MIRRKSDISQKDLRGLRESSSSFLLTTKQPNPEEQIPETQKPNPLIKKTNRYFLNNFCVRFDKLDKEINRDKRFFIFQAKLSPIYFAFFGNLSFELNDKSQSIKDKTINPLPKIVSNGTKKDKPKKDKIVFDNLNSTGLVNEPVQFDSPTNEQFKKKHTSQQIDETKEKLVLDKTDLKSSREGAFRGGMGIRFTSTQDFSSVQLEKSKGLKDKEQKDKKKEISIDKKNSQEIKDLLSDQSQIINPQINKQDLKKSVIETQKTETKSSKRGDSVKISDHQKTAKIDDHKKTKSGQKDSIQKLDTVHLRRNTIFGAPVKRMGKRRMTIGGLIPLIKNEYNFINEDISEDELEEDSFNNFQTQASPKTNQNAETQKIPTKTNPSLSANLIIDQTFLNSLTKKYPVIQSYRKSPKNKELVLSAFKINDNSDSFKQKETHFNQLSGLSLDVPLNKIPIPESLEWEAMEQARDTPPYHLTENDLRNILTSILDKTEIAIEQQAHSNANAKQIVDEQFRVEAKNTEKRLKKQKRQKLKQRIHEIILDIMPIGSRLPTLFLNAERNESSLLLESVKKSVERNQVILKTELDQVYISFENLKSLDPNTLPQKYPFKFSGLCLLSLKTVSESEVKEILVTDRLSHDMLNVFKVFYFLHFQQNEFVDFSKKPQKTFMVEIADFYVKNLQTFEEGQPFKFRKLDFAQKVKLEDFLRENKNLFSVISDISMNSFFHSLCFYTFEILFFFGMKTFLGFMEKPREKEKNERNSAYQSVFLNEKLACFQLKLNELDSLQKEYDFKQLDY